MNVACQRLPRLVHEIHGRCHWHSIGAADSGWWGGQMAVTHCQATAMAIRRLWSARGLPNMQEH
jgi:hypothetical protein